MDKQKMWEIYHGDKKSPCYITDKDTFECLYANDEFFRVYNVSRDIIGNNFYDYVPIIEYHFEGELPDWDKQDYFESDTYSSRLNLRFFIRAVLDRNSNTVFCETILADNDVQANSKFELAMTRCMTILEQPPETQLVSMLELLCTYHNCEATYVYRFEESTETIHLISQWSISPEIVAVQEISSVMDASTVIKMIKYESESSLIIGQKDTIDQTANPVLAAMLDVFQLNNLTMCKVVDGAGETIGIVGMSNPNTTNNFDHRLVHTIARFVAQSVTQEVVNQNIFHVQNRDLLTGLYNRFAYDKKVTEMTDKPPKKLGVVSVNINGLKNINITLGNEAGDQHIKKSGQCIESHLGYDLYRVSGDEFIGLAFEVEKEEFESKVSDLQRKLRNENNYDFSMGRSWAEGNYVYTNLLREADSVMYINKQDYYALGVRTLESVSSVILRDLLSFLANDEFMIYLQPQVRLEDGSLHGAEALIRRFDKTNQKMVFPDQFISMYEQASVIRHVDLFVVDTVCQLLAKWVTKNQAIPISVNLSRVTLQEFGIVDTIVKICDKYHVPHELVVIEVTERVGLIENDVPSALVKNFIDNGFTISLDDFGCAYSNIVTLAQIEVDEVKLDKSLVDNLTTNRKNHILVKNVLSMCDELEGMSTLAEGIEDENQSNLLHELGCHLGQGYFYSRPIPVKEFEEKYVK